MTGDIQESDMPWRIQRGERGSLFPENLPFFNDKFLLKSINLKMLHLCAPYLIQELGHCHYLNFTWNIDINKPQRRAALPIEKKDLPVTLGPLVKGPSLGQGL